LTLTQGQPWLVNALAQGGGGGAGGLIVRRRSRGRTIDAAKEELIRRQDTHLDSLAERLRESRVRRIIEPILAGEAPAPPCRTTTCVT
jgi:hypothetical protein